ncbi:MAG: cell cycle transcriptional regulator TrcR [Alphaproteobacteria bacterium]
MRNKAHWNMANLRQKDPVLLGLCTQTALDNLITNLSKEARPVSNKSH